MRRCVLLGLVAAAVCLGQAASAAEPPIRVVGFSQIGAFKVRGGNPAKARAAFGRPTSTRNTPNRDCLMGWPGIRISFYTLAQASSAGRTRPSGSRRSREPGSPTAASERATRSPRRECSIRGR